MRRTTEPSATPAATRRVALADVGGVWVAIDAEHVHRFIEDTASGSEASPQTRVVLAELWRLIPVGANDAGSRVVELQVRGALLQVVLGAKLQLVEVEARAFAPLPTLLAGIDDTLGVEGVLTLPEDRFALVLDPARLWSLSEVRA